MDKYNHKQIVCKAKNGRHYRQSIGYIGDGLVVCTTTKGRAEKERDYLNQEYNKGWEIEKTEPIVFKDNREDIEKRMEEYENEIKNAQKQAIKEVLEKVKTRLEEYRLENEYFIPNEPNGNLWQMNSSVFYIEVTQDGALIDEIAKEFGVGYGTN